MQFIECVFLTTNNKEWFVNYPVPCFLCRNGLWKHWDNQWRRGHVLPIPSTCLLLLCFRYIVIDNLQFVISLSLSLCFQVHCHRFFTNCELCALFQVCNLIGLDWWRLYLVVEVKMFRSEKFNLSTWNRTKFEKDVESWLVYAGEAFWLDRCTLRGALSLSNLALMHTEEGTLIQTPFTCALHFLYTHTWHTS